MSKVVEDEAAFLELRLFLLPELLGVGESFGGFQTSLGWDPVKPRLGSSR
ncbi:MAG: hypothetical protein ACUVRV_04435 [Cyanobacteriota bacterium]